jgi:response regulator RpfG family c-di-GMP phosphodiesterase
MHATGNIRLLDRLVTDGLISPEQRERVLTVVQSMGERVEEALLDAHAIDEASLLKFLAAQHKTRFVSTEKLAKADIDRATLELIPRKLAEHHTVFPVLFDRQAAVLSVVTPDPDNAVALQEIQLASGAKEVRAFVARPRAVRAAINKAYGGDIHAFANLDRDAHQQFMTMLDVFERNLVSEESLVTSLGSDEGRRERVFAAEDMHPGPDGSPGAGGAGVAQGFYLESVKVLVTLLENGRPDLRGHSAHVARFMRKISERIGLSEVQCSLMTLTGYLHDLGKMSAYHLTALNVAQYDAHAAAAKKTYRAPVRLLEAVGLPRDVTRALEQMYERFDGTGLPGDSSGKEIALGARLLAIADSYADLTQNPRNPFRHILRPAQACEVFGRYRDTIFDANLIDLFRHMVTGDDLRARLLADRHRVMIVDPDPEEATVLELRLLEQGFEVAQAHSSDQALKLLEKGDHQLVVSELDLSPNDGLWLVAEARRHPWGKKLPWVILTGRGGRTEAQRAFELGVVDYMTKPVSADLLVAKLRQLLEREVAASGKRGVSGSLQEMGLPDIVQILWHGRKTGSLKIHSGGDSGEIHFVSGAIYNAMWENLRGEEAFYAMLRLGDGEFVLDPNLSSPQKVIQDSPEALLLEGMRRLDEAGR